MSLQLKNQDISGNNIAQLGEVTSKGGLIVRFRYTQIEANGRFVDRLVVEQQPRGDRSTVSTRYITDEQAKVLFPEQYAKFTAAGGHATEGTPLAEIPGMTNSYIGRLTMHGLTSVEDLLSTSMDQLQQIGRDAVAAHEIAAEWSKNHSEAKEHIERAGDTADLLDRATQAEKERDALKKKLAAAEMKLDIMENIGGRAAVNETGENRARIRPDENDGFDDIDDSDTLFASGAAVLGQEDPDPLADDD